MARDPKAIINSKPLLRLESQHLDIIDALVWGLEAPHPLLDGVPPGQPLSVASASVALNVRRAHIRRLLEDPLFHRTYDKAVQARRSALAPKAVAAIGELIDRKGDDTPADASVRLRAAQAAIGDDKAASISVQVNNNQLAYQPGYVVRLPAGQPIPDTIDAEPAAEG